MANGRFTAIVWLAAFMSSVGVAYAAKDVVITTTGDRLVGEIKTVEKDVLTFSTGLFGCRFQDQVGQDRLD